MFCSSTCVTVVGDAVGDHARCAAACPSPRRCRPCRSGARPSDRHRLRVDAAGRERRVRRRHVERRDRDRAEPDRRHVGAVEVESGVATPSLLRHRGDVLGPDVERQLRVDRVVGVHRRARDARRAEVRVVVGLTSHRFVSQFRPGRAGSEGRREVVRRVRVHALRDRGREHDRLERRARLPPRLRDEVELVAASPGVTAVIARIAPVARVDRDERPRPDRWARSSVVADRVPRGALQARVDRRVDAQPALAHGVRAVLVRSARRARS